MDLHTLGPAIETVGFAALGLSFLAGLVFSFNPVALAAIPVSLAYVISAREPSEAWRFGMLFIAGMVCTQAGLGALAGLGGLGVQMVFGRWWGLLLGPWLVLMGLVWTGWVRLPLPGLIFHGWRVGSAWGAFVFGALFSVAICPVCTPALVALLGVSAGVGSPAWGVALLLAFAVGRAVPIVMGALSLGTLRRLGSWARYQRTADTLGGLTFILMGLYMINAQWLLIPALAV